jgi:hypothetical protein
MSVTGSRTFCGPLMARHAGTAKTDTSQRAERPVHSLSRHSGAAQNVQSRCRDWLQGKSSRLHPRRLRRSGRADSSAQPRTLWQPISSAAMRRQGSSRFELQIQSSRLWWRFFLTQARRLGVAGLFPCFSCRTCAANSDNTLCHTKTSLLSFDHDFRFRLQLRDQPLEIVAATERVEG